MKIALVTGCRSEWGLIEPLYKKLRIYNFRTYVISAGPHNSVEHCNQSEISVYPEWQLIKIESMLSGYSKSAITKSIGMTTMLAAEVMKFHNFDLIVITGDRWESFAVATAAHVARIPMMHLHAGESTLGSTDDAFRHSISNMATYLGAPNRRSLSFLNKSRNGEKYIKLIGALGLHKIDEVEPDKGDWTAVMSYHPQTIGNCGITTKHIFNAIYAFFNGDVQVFLASQSPDVGLDPSRFGSNATREHYLSILKKAKFIIGNSSSGIIEAPALGTPTINIGSRQSGRPMGQSIYQVDTKEDLVSALESVIRLKEREYIFGRSYTKDGVEGAFKWIMEIAKNVDMG